jgi:hypothetical protein
MRMIRIAIIAVAVGTGVVLGGLPAVAATTHMASTSTVTPFTCPPRPTPGFCPGG